MNTTHKIIRMVRGETANSKSPMWRCETLEGERVNVFQHVDGRKDSSRLFASAGYLESMLEMAVDGEMTWRAHPIAVEMVKNGQWWEIVAVARKPDGAAPDVAVVIDATLYGFTAPRWARALCANPDVRYIDVETTGLGRDAEIIAIAILDNSSTLLSALVCPEEIERVNDTTSIHGLTSEDVTEAATFPLLYPEISRLLEGKILAAYNVQFDARMLENNCVRHGLAPIAMLGLNDVMTLYAILNGVWDAKNERFKSVKLSEAASALEVGLFEVHNALSDVKATRDIVWEIGRV